MSESISNRKLLVIAGGSPSSIIATYLYLSDGGVDPETVLEQMKAGEIQVVFTQAFQVGEHPRFGVSEALKAVRELPKDGQVVWIGLGVNNQDPQMTENIFREIGIDRLHVVCDEHEPERWEALMEKLGFVSGQFSLKTKPEHRSAASIVAEDFGVPIYEIFVQAGDWADNRQMDVSDEAQRIAFSISAATKLRMGDNAFRVTALLHLLGDREARKEFYVRLEAAGPVYAAVEEALANAQMQGQILVVHKKEGEAGLVFDDTDAMNQGYARAPFVVVIGEKSGEGPCIQVGVNNSHPTLGKTNLLQVLADFGPTGIVPKVAIRGTENLFEILVRLNAL
ncbi:hypothetical protein HYV70_05165 [Candidatus Uhrbacteria bacterium]|nr:hypothetical protein [Candidatus Uhrbacteria bacterium]